MSTDLKKKMKTSAETRENRKKHMVNEEENLSGLSSFEPNNVLNLQDRLGHMVTNNNGNAQ